MVMNRNIIRMVLIASAASALTLTAPAHAQAAQPTSAAQAARPLRADSNGDGVVTRAEARSGAEAAFARMDADRDGRLTRADREAVASQMSDRLFTAADANGDGSISRAEWDAARQRRQAERMARHAGGEQHADRGERGGHHGRGAGRHGGGRHVAAMLRRADTNGDQAIDRQEFMATAMQRFDRVDADKDGRITTAERDAARSALRATMQRLRSAVTGN